MRAVLITIADAANRDGEHAHPGMMAIVDGSLYSEGHVRRVLGQLVRDGWIEQTENGGGPGHAAVFRLPGVAQEQAAHSARLSEPSSSSKARASRAKRTPKARASRASGASLSSLSNGNGLYNGNSDAAVAARDGTLALDLSTSTAIARPTDDPVVKRAHDLTVLAFEQKVKPELRSNGKGAFPAVLGILERLLRSGRSVQELDAAIRDGIDVWTVAGIQTSFARRRPRSPLMAGGDMYEELADAEQGERLLREKGLVS